ncbi:MAG TPA: DUF1996 domain-containing protein, partial [Actinoplanes sp.]|nr:DUF1996 domain-containing protein [Actinoplanes sp.]
MSDATMVSSRRRRSISAALLAAVAGIAASVAAPPAAHADVSYVFNVSCPISHFGSDDPIVAPGLPGASHRHAFYGNATTDAFTTTASLLKSRSTCERGFGSADRSAYWVPTLYRKEPGKGFKEVRLSPEDQYLSAYYRRSGGTAGEKVKPFPPGLRMVTGNPTARKPQPTLDVAWRCNGDPAGYLADIPNCPAGTVLQAIVGFPDCWDGINLDSADHQSHMAPSRGERGTCPKAHPVKLPQLTFEISFWLPAVAGATYELSSGGRYSLHGDFFAAWDDRVQSALVNSCLNGGRYCENHERSMVDLTAAGPVMRGREPAAPTSGPTASLPPATTAPATRPSSASAVPAAQGAGQRDAGVAAAAVAAV